VVSLNYYHLDASSPCLDSGDPSIMGIDETVAGYGFWVKLEEDLSYKNIFNLSGE